MRWWLFGNRAKTASIDPVVLTEEEQKECQAMLRSLTKAEGGQYVMREDLIASFKRSITALCMMGRAQRFLILANSRPEYKEEACRAAAKACAVFPLSIYFYDFACVLDEVGKPREAEEMFTECLRRCGSETLDAIMQTTLNQRNVEEAVRNASARVENEKDFAPIPMNLFRRCYQLVSATHRRKTIGDVSSHITAAGSDDMVALALIPAALTLMGSIHANFQFRVYVGSRGRSSH